MTSKGNDSWSRQAKIAHILRILKSIAAVDVYLLIGYNFFPFQLPVMDSVTDRLVFTLRWQLLGALTLFMGMVGVLQIRGQSEAAADPIKGHAENLTQLPRHILQNTMEQYLFHFVGQVVLCTYLSSDSMKVIPLLVVNFVVARVLFKIGYEMGGLRRTYGFAATISPTISTYAYCAYCFVSYGAGYGLG